MNINHKLLFLLTIGLIVRLTLAFLPGFRIDVNDWFAWSARLSNFDFARFYSKDVFTDYTPGYLYILSMLSFLKNSLGLSDSFYYFLLKIPAIISELFIGILVYKEVKKYIPQKWALLTLSLILFNPVMIFNSSVWGQIDSFLTLLMLITVLALNNNKLIICSIFFGLAFFTKPQALALAPILALFLIKHPKPLNLFSLTIPGFLIVFTLTFPFFPSQTLINLAQHIINTASEYSYTSVNAYNMWGVVGFWISDNLLWSNLSYQMWGYIFFMLYWVIAGYLYLKGKLSIYALAALATLGFFFLPTKVHERYLYPALVFLILLITIYKSKLISILTVLLSILHLLNLYYVYVYYNEIYFQMTKVFYNQIIYNFLAANGRMMSLVSTAIFILISIAIIKYYVPLKKS